MRIDLSAKLKENKAKNNTDVYALYKKLLKARESLAGLVTGIFILSNTVTFAAPNVINIQIVDDSELMSVSTSYTSVSDVLAEQGIKLGEYDKVSPEVNEKISDSQVIVVERVNKIIVNDAGKTSEYYSSANSYESFFNENNIMLGEFDTINVDLISEPKNNDIININRVEKIVQTIEEDIPFKTIEVSDPTRKEGTVVETKGVNGKRVVEFEVVISNGEVVSRNEVSSVIVSKPVDKTVYIGTNAASADGINYSRVLKCSATAYDLSYQSCGKRPGDKGYGITATGTRACYGTVAVDPSVIPLGSKLYIETTDGSFSYGYAVAADTGGAIKGNKVDLFFDSNSACLSFGRRTVNVYIIN